MKTIVIDIYQQRLLQWYSVNKRYFPWRYTNNPYHVLVSEVLLQQTDAGKVLPAFEELLCKYPDLISLARADIEHLTKVFEKLGLFYRAGRLLSISNEIIHSYYGLIPNSREKLLRIKGIGDYAANAVLCFGFNLPFAIVDTNVIRIIGRVFDVWSDKKRSRTDKSLWEFAQSILPEEDYINTISATC